MQEGKLCPLLTAAGKINVKCNDRCAWYDECAGECAVLSLAGTLRELHFTMRAEENN